MNRSLLLLLATTLARTASAQISLGTSPVTIDFDEFRGAGFAPSPADGQLNSSNYDVLGLSDGPAAGSASLFGDVQDAGDFARGTSAGGVTSGGVYAFEMSPGDFALGFQPTGSDFQEGVVNVLFENTTGSRITAISGQGTFMYYNDAPRSTGLGLGVIPGVVIDASGQETSRDTSNARLIVPELLTPEDADATPAWTSVAFSGTAEGLNIAPGERFYLRFFSRDISGSGARDEIAVDDLVITAVSAVANETGTDGEATVRPLFPNPVSASASAQVAFSTPRSERVTVRVYDALGRLVATAFDGPTAGASETRVALPARLAPGTYVVRVAGETFASTRPLTVVR